MRLITRLVSKVLRLAASTKCENCAASNIAGGVGPHCGVAFAFAIQDNHHQTMSGKTWWNDRHNSFKIWPSLYQSIVSIKEKESRDEYVNCTCPAHLLVLAHLLVELIISTWYLSFLCWRQFGVEEDIIRHHHSSPSQVFQEVIRAVLTRRSMKSSHCQHSYQTC